MSEDSQVPKKVRDASQQRDRSALYKSVFDRTYDGKNTAEASQAATEALVAFDAAIGD